MERINLWSGQLLSLAEVAAQLRRHPKTITRWARSGRLEAVKVGGRYATTREAVDRLVRREERPTSNSSG